MKTTRRSPWLTLAAVVCTTALAGAASAQNPFDAELRRLATQARREGRVDVGVMPLEEMMATWQESTPSRTIALFERLRRDRGLSPARQALVGWMLARGYAHQGDFRRSEALTSELGYVTDWQVVGPFDNEGRSGFGAVQGPEAARNEAFDASATYRGKEREIGWRRYVQRSEHGYVNFDAVMRPYQNTCAFAVTTVVSEREQPLSLWFGAGGASKVFWNGQEVYSDPVTRAPYAERSAVGVVARQGVNRLLMKVCITEQNWGFYMRVADANGGPASGIRINADEIAMAATGATSASAPDVRGPLEALAAAATTAQELDAESASSRDKEEAAKALERYATFLYMTGADDPAEFTARQVAAQAVTLAPTPQRLLLAAELTDQRGEAMRFEAIARERFPRDPESLLFQARVRRSGLNPSEAIPLLDRIRGRGTVDVEAKLLRAGILLENEMPHAARAIVEGLSRQLAGSPMLAYERARMESAVGHVDAALARRVEAVGLYADDVRTRRLIIGDALRRGETRVVDEHLDVVRALTDDSGRGLGYVAAIEEALGRNDAALATLQAARELCPEDASAIVAHGRMLLRIGQRDAAAATLREALVLRPQDASTRELLEQIQPEERADEAYAATSTTLLARRGESGGYPLTMLQDLTVNTVYENGLGSSFHQIAAQIHDEEGARGFRQYGIQYDPGSQRVDVRLARVYRASGEVLEATQLFTQRLGEPWYRIYYDTRALVIELPDLEPGDVVEIRYRVDDVAHRNLFADYYGDLAFLQRRAPTSHVEYVLRTPPSREFYFNEPALEGLSHTREVQDGVRVDRWVADNVQALYGESNMPGATEVTPYLHVSTYRTWEDVGRWYWGLIQDQLYADDSLQQTVRELVAGAPDERTKVERIHNWVLEHTRYVGLEFGIHGFKPYRVSQIVRRGFGDCKDKASLLYTMFRAAGIDAHIVLVRTRRNGDIRDLPASLAVFDHAIAYVPGLDLYIDGTAEHSGLDELPQMDQGVTVLHVWPEGASLRRTPVHPATANTHERTLEVTLAADGSATMNGSEQITGVQAAGFRSRYAAPGTRDERMQQRLRRIFSGAELTSQQFEGLDDIERPIRFRYETNVPQLAVRDGQQLRMAPSTIGDLTRALAPTTSRRHALDLSYPNQYTERRTVTLPAGATPATLPTNGRAESPFGVASLTVTRNGQRLVIESHFELRRDRVEASDYAAFRTWVEAASELFRQRILIQAPSAGGAQ